eukprot:jgi/Bigna1/66100/fgenesh1_pg.1_\
MGPLIGPLLAGMDLCSLYPPISGYGIRRRQQMRLPIRCMEEDKPTNNNPTTNQNKKFKGIGADDIILTNMDSKGYLEEERRAMREREQRRVEERGIDDWEEEGWEMGRRERGRRNSKTTSRPSSSSSSSSSARLQSLSIQPDRRKCGGCGAALQTSNSRQPGYLPPTVFINYERDLLFGDTAEDELEYEAEGEKRGAKNENENKPIICQRCHNLTRRSSVEKELTTQWSSESSLSPERFKELISEIRSKDCVVIFVVDLFDFHGTFLNDLEEIVGGNPVILAANKVDLLPPKANQERTIRWIRRELVRYQQYQQKRRQRQRRQRRQGHEDEDDKGGEDQEPPPLRVDKIHLISSMKGTNVKAVFDNAQQLAEMREKEEAAAAAIETDANEDGKEILQRMLDDEDNVSLDLDDYLDLPDLEREGGGAIDEDDDIIDAEEIRAWRRRKKMNRRAKKEGGGKKDAISISRLPGTTLDMIRIAIQSGTNSIYDTPGLIMPSQLTHRLLPQELEDVVPSKRISYESVELKQGKALLLGGLVEIEMISGKPFYFTLFISKAITVHPTRADNAENYVSKHGGKLLTPPFSQERFMELRPFKEHRFRVRGIGFTQASTDIVLSGLGWVSVTGSGPCEIKVSGPEGMAIFTREPLMPNEFKRGKASKFTGKRFTR